MGEGGGVAGTQSPPPCRHSGGGAHLETGGMPGHAQGLSPLHSSGWAESTPLPNPSLSPVRGSSCLPCSRDLSSGSRRCPSAADLLLRGAGLGGCRDPGPKKGFFLGQIKGQPEAEQPPQRAFRKQHGPGENRSLLSQFTGRNLRPRQGWAASPGT